ncbi:hypothetical protein BPOR_0162g00040 [Botrytis porri]|uniref:Uncharacterized protein n=1 Tax=Botrytis porri TaxID=87229 RepID=A0A4Z1KV99_9HELO|nr:hypothetical protein BPOR_0162g00040 [Botrytis porri]
MDFAMPDAYRGWVGRDGSGGVLDGILDGVNGTSNIIIDCFMKGVPAGVPAEAFGSRIRRAVFRYARSGTSHSLVQSIDPRNPVSLEYGTCRGKDWDLYKSQEY